VAKKITVTAEGQVQDIVYSLAASPQFAEDGLCFAARGSGLYRSDDGGLTWRSLYDSLNLNAPLATMAVAISPDFGADHQVYAGVSEGILCSSDAGKNWLVIVLPSPPPLVSTLVLSPDFTQDGTLLAGTMEAGVYRTSDRGRHWSPWNFGLLDLNVLTMAISPNFANDETVFIGVLSGIFRSTNGGRSWRETSFSTEWAPVLSLALSPNYVHDGVLFAGTESYGLFHSADRGDTWTRLGEAEICEAVNGILLSPGFPGKPDVFALLSSALLISRAAGKSWSAWKNDLTIDGALASVAAPQGLDPGAPLLVGLVEGGVLRI
jgi:hypothetical protein